MDMLRLATGFDRAERQPRVRERGVVGRAKRVGCKPGPGKPMIVAFTENALEREHDEWLLFLDASNDSWLPAMVTAATMHGQRTATQTGGATPHR
ncbi:MAG: hypothetical protein WAV60_13350 [Anaerolineae bacterium]